MKELGGKVAFVTGGASGIGLGQAKVLAEEARMKVAIADVQQSKLDEAKAYFADKDVDVHFLNLDITDRSAFAAARDEVEEVLGPVQLLMNTAGVSMRGPVEDATYDDWDWHLDVNLNGVINGVRTFLPRMIELGRGGHIVNTASISAFFAIPTAALYTTTKFAVRGLSEALRVELGKYDIGVSCLCPGAVNTNILDAPSTRQSRFGESGFKVDPQIAQRMKALLAAGYDPIELARVTVEGLERNDFWIFPFPEHIQRIEAGNKELIEAMIPWLDHPDYAVRRAAELAALAG